MSKDIVIFHAGDFRLHLVESDDSSVSFWIEFGQEYSCKLDDILLLVSWLRHHVSLVGSGIPSGQSLGVMTPKVLLGLSDWLKNPSED